MLLCDFDDARVWKAISWKGNFEASERDNGIRPSDEDFKIHFERVLNPIRVPTLLHVSNDVIIPLLDDPIFLVEV